MNGIAIVGYCYGDDEDTYCPSCIRDLFVPFDLVAETHHTAEDVLDHEAARQSIDRQDDNSFSSYQFPKPILSGDATTVDYCVLCGRRLVDAEPAS
jgi:hypothetical protein